MREEMTALILAGGRGSRLKSLTTTIAKPAVFFGGKYRIIDFVMSNISNSNIKVVGVATQYESTVLNNYVGFGSNWGLDGQGCLTSVLPPRETSGGANWYLGTADAVTQNIDWIDKSHCEYLLILSGDHIYKMDYSKMLEFHKKNKADVTIACIEVPIEEASRFGIVVADKNDQIVEFQEKPEKPKSTLASMGIYIFTYDLLRKILLDDSKDKDSEHDFGKNILPNMLNNKKRLFAYKFDGYWKDVGTVQSLWQSNMDLLDPECSLNLFDSSFKIYSADTKSTPQFISSTASVENSLINQGAVIFGKVEHSVISNEVTVEKGAKVSNSVILPGAKIKSGVKVEYAIIGDKVCVEKDVIGNKDNIELFDK